MRSRSAMTSRSPSASSTDELDAGPLGKRGHDAGDVVEERCDRLGRDHGMQASRLEPREREQVGHQPAETVGLDLHGLHEVVAHLGIVLGAVVEQLEHPLERGDRRAHLMARIRDELPLRVFDALPLGHVGE